MRAALPRPRSGRAPWLALEVPALLVVLAAIAAWAGPARAAVADDLAARLEAQGFESVRVATEDSVCRIRLEDRRFRNPNFGFGVIAALAARTAVAQRCELVLERQGCAVVRLEWRSADFVAFCGGGEGPEEFFHRLRVELLPRAPGRGTTGLSPALRRVDLVPRVFVDTQFGHVQEPFDYHVEIAPELTTQPWPGARLRLGWTFPIQHAHDILAGSGRPDYHSNRPEEADLFQFLRLGGGWLASVGGGYFGLNRYGLSGGLSTALGSRWYLEGSADVTGSLAFHPEVVYSSLSRVTFAGEAACHLAPPDVTLRLRGGRYLYGRLDSGAGEYALRAEVARHFHQIELAFFGLQSQTARMAGMRLGLPLPPAIRLRPSALRPNLPPSFPVEYRYNEGAFQMQPVESTLRSALLDDLWPASIRAQLDQWQSGARHAGGPAAPGGTSAGGSAP